MSFTQLIDKGTTTDVRLASWCPSMDLLALVTSDGQLALHRLNWQRLWSIAPDSPVTALCWQPDGKLLAAALQARCMLPAH
jgi:anaphase-promoting complex subunit 4